MSCPCFDDAEALGSDAFLHLAEVGFTGCMFAVSADLSEAGVSSEAFHMVLDVRDLFMLAEHEGS